MKDIPHRRDFLQKLGVGVLGLGFSAALLPRSSQSAEGSAESQDHQRFMKGTVDFKGFTAREVTPNDMFYITSYSSTVPNISPEVLRLKIAGRVKKPYELTLTELKSMQDKSEYVTLECIGNPVGGEAIGNALWEGVTLRKVLEKAMPETGVVKVVFYAEDGYYDSIPYNLARSDDVFLAFSMNGEPLPKVHGYPLRVIVPGIYGMKNVKWLSRIELVNSDFKGYWEKQGWSDAAVIPIKSQILMPMDGKRVPLGHYVVGGVAFAGRHGISRVQVSLDEGKSWRDAELKPPLSQWAWVLWRYDWTPSKESPYTIMVRGFDRAGKVQEAASFAGRLFGSTFPDGAKGLHAVDVLATRTSADDGDGA